MTDEFHPTAFIGAAAQWPHYLSLKFVLLKLFKWSYCFLLASLIPCMLPCLLQWTSRYNLTFETAQQ